MPILPYKPDLGFTQDTVSARPSEGAHMAQAESFSRIGKNLVNTGAVVAQIDRSYREENQRKLEYNGETYARKSAEENINKVLVDKDLKEDGSNWFELYGKYNEQAKKTFLKNTQADASQKAGLNDHMDRVMSNSYDNALKFKLEYMKQSGEKAHLGVQNSTANEAYSDPYRAPQYAERYDGFVDGSQLLGSKSAAKFEGRKKIGEAAINSFLEQKKYKDAKLMLNKFAGSFTPEEHQRRNAEIDKSFYEDSRVQYKQDQDDDKKAKLFIRERQSSTFKRYLGDLKELDNQDAPDYATKLEYKLKDIQQDRATNDLNLDQATILQAAARRDSVEEDVREVGKLTDMLLRKDVDGFESALGTAVGNRQVSGEKAISMMGEYERIKAKIGPKKVLSQTDHEITALVGTVEARVKAAYGGGLEGNLHYKLEGGEEKVAMIKLQFQKNMKNPNFKNPDQAMNAAVARFVKQKDPAGAAGIKGANAIEKMHSVQNMFDKKQIDPGKYKKLMHDLAIQAEKEQGDNARKDGN